MAYAFYGSGRRLRTAVIAVAATIACLSMANGRTAAQSAPVAPAVDVSALWQEPADIEQRDLFHGAGGQALLPPAGASFTFVKEDRTGYSPGFDVRDAAGGEWSVKLGSEAQPEVATSRILWALGFHQPPTYFVQQWTMTGGPAGAAAPGAGRFRPELPDRKVVGDWSWSENPFVNSQAYRGLIVANLMLNNWDWKTSNNKIYEVNTGDGAITRQYVVRDLGASLGKTASPKVLRLFGWRGAQGSRNDVADFEAQGFIKAVTGNVIDFDYRGIYGSIVKRVTPADVVWTSQLMSRLSDAQLDDAFRAAGYPEDVRKRFVAKLKSKVAEGLKLADGATAPPAVSQRTPSQ